MSTARTRKKDLEGTMKGKRWENLYLTSTGAKETTNVKHEKAKERVYPFARSLSSSLKTDISDEEQGRR